MGAARDAARLMSDSDKPAAKPVWLV